MPKPLVIQTEHLDDTAAAWLRERCEVEKVSYDDEPAFSQALARAAGLVIRTYTRVNADLLARAPGLRVVGRAGAGLDNIDLPACAKRGVAVVSTPDANTRAVIEYVWALLLDATRPRAFLEGPLEPARWREVREEFKAARQLCQLTLGIYGFGRIGSGMARVAQAMHMRAVYHDLREIPAGERWGAQPVSREQLLAESDAITVHVDGRRANAGLLDATAFGRMKENVIFVNSSRGFVVENHAVAEFMIANPGACAMLDVHEPEPFDATYPLLEIPNVHLAPHIASATDLAHANMSWVVKDVWRVLSGEKPEFPAAAGAE